MGECSDGFELCSPALGVGSEPVEHRCGGSSVADDRFELCAEPGDVETT
jgi:hypothetical protein